MDTIQNIYDSLWEKSIENFKNNIFELDNSLNSTEQDHRRGLTLIGRLKDETAQRILEVLNQCKLIDPNQHYYDESNLHTTILSIVSCHDGFDLERIDKYSYINLINKATRYLGPIKIAFKGITASPSCIMVQGFPEDNTLNLLRAALREEFKSSDLYNSMDERYTLQTAHSTVIRFKKPITDSSLLVDCLNKYRYYDFGVSEINKLEFVYSDWYMSKSSAIELEAFNLNG